MAHTLIKLLIPPAAGGKFVIVVFALAEIFWTIFSYLGHPKLIKLFPSARASFPPGFAQARISSLLMKTAIPEKETDMSSLLNTSIKNRRAKRGENFKI